MSLLEIFVGLQQRLAADQKCDDLLANLSQHLKRFRPTLHHAFGGTTADEDEILNTVCEKIWNGVRRFRGQSEGEAFNYCRTIVAREIINYRRHIAKTVGAISFSGATGSAPLTTQGTAVEDSPDPSTASDEDTPDPAEATEDRRLIVGALDQLNPVERDLLQLNLLEGIQIAEIARSGGETQEALSKRKVRALAKLRHLLPSHLADGRKLVQTRVGRGTKRRQPSAMRDVAGPPPAIVPSGNPRKLKRVPTRRR